MKFCGGVRRIAILGALLFLGFSPQVRADQERSDHSLDTASGPVRDIDYPGTLRLFVDATDLDHRLFRVRETVPVKGSQPLTLYLPKWTPGRHGESGALEFMTGLVATSGGRRVEWVRDTVDVNAFHLVPPEGAKEIEVAFEMTTPTRPEQGRVVMSPEMVSLEWINLILYPAGFYAHRIMVAPSVLAPPGFTVAGALEVMGEPERSAAGDLVTFQPTALDDLADSPLIAGKYFQRYTLDGGPRAQVFLDVVGDYAASVDAREDQIARHKALVVQADRLFGERPFAHYDFLLTLSDRLGSIGLEHRQSSEDSGPTDYFLGWERAEAARVKLAHEYVHAWNGKHRLPADLWTPDFNTPMQDSLLWVYEGQTEYWGEVLAARSGLYSRQFALDVLAYNAASLDVQQGRAWKSLQDTTNDPIVAGRRATPWRSWRRSEDYYREGQLIWLDIDTLIRKETAGRSSLDDVARAFFGRAGGASSTYRVQDLTAALNAVLPYDWAGFLKQRLDGHGPGAPLDGLARGGYRLVYSEAPSEYEQLNQSRSRILDLTFSLGLSVGRDQVVSDVVWNGPAFKAGLSTADRIVAVNGLSYDTERLRLAIQEGKDGKPIELILENTEHYRTVRIGYRDGLRYPHLEKTGPGPAILDALLAPKP